MTPAHSAGTAVFSSLRQLATMASRSTLSTPVAVASAAALFASGERMEFAGIDFGSEAMFMPYSKRGKAAVQPPMAGTLVGSVGQLVFEHEIAKARDGGVEVELDGAGRTV